MNRDTYYNPKAKSGFRYRKSDRHYPREQRITMLKRTLPPYRFTIGKRGQCEAIRSALGLQMSKNVAQTTIELLVFCHTVMAFRNVSTKASGPEHQISRNCSAAAKFAGLLAAVLIFRRRLMERFFVGVEEIQGHAAQKGVL